MQTVEFYSHGKLLLTGEYVVLDGAEALALPCKLGQSLNVEKHDNANFVWTSYLQNGELWHKTVFNLEDVKNIKSKNAFEKRLFEILKVVFQLKPEIFKNAYKFCTRLDFEKEWGLGSSSTLINNLSKWAEIDPYILLEKTFGGSGYDIAAANLDQPFIYKRENNDVFTSQVKISDHLKPHIFFVYLNQKQNSRAGIRKYREKKTHEATVKSISEITNVLKNTSSITDFENLLKNHESLISEIIGIEPIQTHLFKDYNSGIVKSLGAWGGDFVLVTVKDKSNLDYFREKNYDVIFSYDDLVFEDVIPNTQKKTNK